MLASILGNGRGSLFLGVLRSGWRGGLGCGCGCRLAVRCGGGIGLVLGSGFCYLVGLS